MSTVTRCPICGRETDAAFRPFCSVRCADIDLGRWLKGTYVIPTEEEPDDIAVPVAEDRNF